MTFFTPDLSFGSFFFPAQWSCGKNTASQALMWTNNQTGGFCCLMFSTFPNLGQPQKKNPAIFSAFFVLLFFSFLFYSLFCWQQRRSCAPIDSRPTLWVSGGSDAIWILGAGGGLGFFQRRPLMSIRLLTLTATFFFSSSSRSFIFPDSCSLLHNFSSSLSPLPLPVPFPHSTPFS